MSLFKDISIKELWNPPKEKKLAIYRLKTNSWKVKIKLFLEDSILFQTFKRLAFLFAFILLFPWFLFIFCVIFCLIQFSNRQSNGKQVIFRLCVWKLLMFQYTIDINITFFTKHSCSMINCHYSSIFHYIVYNKIL